MKFKKLVSITLAFIMCTGTAFAHSGRTDSSGGHRDNKNASGLGSYHYHCGGYPAHLHTNGVCPYSSGYSGSASSGSSGSSGSSNSSGSPYTQSASDPNRNNVYLMHTMPQMTVGETFTAQAVSNNTSAALTWSSSDNSVASVNSSTGQVTANGIGTAVITVSNGYKSASYTVTCKGYIAYTNTQGKINGEPIQLYTYNNEIYVLCNDLNNYGFDAQYTAENALVKITRNTEKSLTPNTVISYPDGKIAYVAESTQIKVLCSSNTSYSKSVNGDGRMFVAFDSLAAFGTVSHNDNTLELNTL